MDICKLFLLQIRFNIYSALIKKKNYMSAWSDLSMSPDWYNMQSLTALIYVYEGIHVYLKAVNGLY